jgi:esterase/lipase superfamily enzyme
LFAVHSVARPGAFPQRTLPMNRRLPCCRVIVAVFLFVLALTGCQTATKEPEPPRLETAATMKETQEWLHRTSLPNSSPGIGSNPNTAPAITTGPAPTAGSTTSSSGAGKKEFIVVPVHYATDRMPLMDLAEWRSQLRARGSDFAYYGGHFSGKDDAKKRGLGAAELEYGMCSVSVPLRHVIGAIERPSVARLEFHESVAEHFVVLGLKILTEEEFVSGVNATVGKLQHGDAFVFIHGFNVTFSAAVMRAAQLAADFQFPGAPIVYSWSSRGEVTSYEIDANSVDLTRDRLVRFLEDVLQRTGAQRIHLVAHSMGNRALVAALRVIAEKGNGTRFANVVLAAPDVNRQNFIEQLAAPIAKVANRVTLYASADDRALWASQRFGGYARLGQAGSHLTVVPGMDTVDASGIDTSRLSHSYFGEKNIVLNDIAYTLFHGAPPEGRKLSRVDSNLGTHWSFLPPEPK